MTHHIVWFRRDLRLADNPAWAAATQRGDEVTALFVLDERLLLTAGSFRLAVLFDHLRALDGELRERGGRLRVESGKAEDVLPQLVARLGASRVHINGDTSPFAVRRDHAVRSRLTGQVDTHWGTLVHEPGRILTQKGTLSRVFTPFHKVWDRTEMTPWISGEGEAKIAADKGQATIDAEPPAAFGGGEAGAESRLTGFLEIADRYLELRDLPAVDGTSMLSADLRFGTLSPRAVAAAVGETTNGRQGFVRQLAWRDWYAHLLSQQPTMVDRAIRSEYVNVTWRTDPQGLEAWKTGRTGFPIVDAGMRQLLHTGWMHNRVRMIAGSFLVKDLLIDWREGERWFRRLLIDADVAQNAGNWQWVAGCGTDAAPYFRVFNPWTQSAKFDPAGDYIRRWVPELAEIRSKAVHQPSLCGPLELAASGVFLGDSYPYPIVDHAVARQRVLSAYKTALGR